MFESLFTFAVTSNCLALQSSSVFHVSIRCVTEEEQILIVGRIMEDLKRKREDRRFGKRMNDELDPIGVDFLWSFLFATKGYIFPQLRLASLDWNRHSVDAYFYIDGQLSEDDEEALSLIGTYFGVDLGPEAPNSYTEHIIRIDYPEPISFQGQCVFARRESPPIGKIARGIITERWLSRFDKVCVAIQRVMVGNIFPQLRYVWVDWTEDSARLYFEVHGAISQEDRTSIDLITNFFRLQFPNEEMRSCDVEVARVDFPKISDRGEGRLVYWRKEYCSNHPSTPCPFLLY